MHLMLNPSRVRRARPIRRTGFTMAETLVVLVLLAIVGGSLMNVLTRQQRFYNGTGELIALRTQLRQAQAVVGNDLRGISSVGSAGVGSDVITMTDSSIDFRYTLGVGVVCKNPPASTTIVIPPTCVLTNGNTLTSWINKPTFGDTAFIFDEGASATSPTDDTWPAFKVISLALGSGSCDGSFNAAGGSTLTLDHAVSPKTLEGAAVRFVRHAHYSLYQSPPVTGLWYLGYCSGDCGSGVSPIAGPFQSYQA